MQAAFAINFIRQFKLLLKYRSMIRWCKEWQFLAIRCIYLASRDNSLLSAIVSIILEPALKIFFPSPSLSFFFFTELIIHSTLFLHHGNWFSHKSNDFFSFWPPLRYHGKMFLYSFILFVPIRFFTYDLLCEANVLVNCQLTSLKLTRYNWQFFPMYIYIYFSINKFSASGVLCLARFCPSRSHDNDVKRSRR